MESEKKVALVTGASRGIGRAIAIGLAAEGVAVGINYHSRPDAAEEGADGLAVGDVALYELEPRVLGDASEAQKVPSVGQVVEDDHPPRRLLEGEPDEIASDEPGAAGDDDRLHALL